MQSNGLSASSLHSLQHGELAETTYLVSRTPQPKNFLLRFAQFVSLAIVLAVAGGVLIYLFKGTEAERAARTSGKGSDVTDASCSANALCLQQGLDAGDCCPTGDGIFLGCCPTSAASCAANAACVIAGVDGDCCPTPGGEYLACCP